MESIRLTLDYSTVERCLLEIDTLLTDSDCAVEFSDESLEFLLRLIDSGTEVVRIEPLIAVGVGASELRGQLKISDSFRELVSALRASDRDGRIVI